MWKQKFGAEVGHKEVITFNVERRCERLEGRSTAIEGIGRKGLAEQLIQCFQKVPCPEPAADSRLVPSSIPFTPAVHPGFP